MIIIIRDTKNKKLQNVTSKTKHGRGKKVIMMSFMVDSNCYRYKLSCVNLMETIEEKTVVNTQKRRKKI